MNSRNIAWLVVGAVALPSLALGDPPTPTPMATTPPVPAADAAATSPAAPTVAAPALMVDTPTAAATSAPMVAAPAIPDAAPMASVPVAPVVVVLPDPVAGDSVTTVLTALGKPNGVITLPDKYLMMFDRGNVVMSPQDVVLETRLTPLAVYTARLTEQVAEENDRRNAKAHADALLDLLLNDPSYVAMSTRDRLLALAKFDRDHPGSDAHQDYLDLLAVYAAEQATHAKVADLQTQAADARAQALFAQQQAANIEQQLRLAQMQTAAAQQQAAAAQRQAAIAQQTNVMGVVGVGGPVVRTGTGGIVITGGGVPIQKQPPTINNNSINNVPPKGVEIVLPDGTIKYIPGNSTNNGNPPTYF